MSDLDEILNDRVPLENLDGDKELLQSIRLVFLETAQPTLADLSHKSFRANPVEFLRTVHSLKSSAGAIGAAKLSDLAKNIEQLIRKNEFEEAQALITVLIECFNMTIVELQKK